MLRARRQTPKAQACQLFANSSLMHGDAEALFDLAFQINAPPAHNPIGFGRVASITGQARSTLTRENGQPTDSNLAQPSSVILLRARTPICASVF